MCIAKLHFIVAASFLVVTAHAADGTWPIYFTNQTAIANANTTLSAVLSGSTQSRTNIEALVGSQVVFDGMAQQTGSANLVVASNILVEVELQPVRDVNRNDWPDFHRQTFAEVLGTLKSVDFEKRVIHIQAKPEDWRVTRTY